MHKFQWSALGALVLSGALMSCAAPPPTGKSSFETMPTSQLEPKVVPVGCPDVSTWVGFFPPAEELGAIPATFTPAGVIMCTIENHPVPGEGTWSFLVEQRANSGLETFVDDLRRLSSELTNGACPAVLILTPWFELIGPGGQGLRVAVPRDECGQPRAAALDALRALPFTTTEETRLEQVETQAAVDSGCAMGWKNMPAIEVKEGATRSSAQNPVFQSAPVQLSLCRFSTEPADDTAGTFVSGKSLTGTVAADVVAELEASPPANACTQRSGTFAVLMPNPAGATAYVELDGCHRILTDAHELRQASPALIALLS